MYIFAFELSGITGLNHLSGALSSKGEKLHQSAHLYGFTFHNRLTTISDIHL